MMMEWSRAPRTSSNQRTPICRIRPGIIQPNTKNTPIRISSRNPTMAMIP